jgi:hypothetical protein
MTGPVRVQLSRAKGWKMPPNTVSVARPTVFGNHYRVNGDGIPDQATAVRLYRHWLTTTESGTRAAESIRSLLRGKNLACWCPLGSPCHADVLLEVANG